MARHRTIARAQTGDEGHPGERMRAAGLRLWVAQYGPQDGPAVLLIHGLAFHGGAFRRNVEALSRAGLRVIVPDLPGHGRSDGKRHRATYTPRFFARVLWSLLDSLDVEHCALVGNSLGGAVAVRMAASAPARTSRLVLIDSAGLSAAAVPWRTRLLYVPVSLPLLLGLAPPAALVRRFAERAVVHDPAQAPALTAELRRQPPLASAVRRSALALLGAEGSVADALPSLSMPALLVWGEHDPQFPIAIAREAADHLPDATLVTVPGAGHVPMFEAAERVNRLLVDFLAPGPGDGGDVAPAHGAVASPGERGAGPLRPHRTLALRRRPSNRRAATPPRR